MIFALIIFLGLILTGCATSPVYNSTPAASPPEVAFNESGFKALQEGMTRTQVHKIMGQELVIGYAFQAPDYKPLTIPNPYKIKFYNIAASGYVIEFYMEAIRRPDGIISDDELMPLIFKNDKLIGRGWPLANSLRPAKSSA